MLVNEKNLKDFKKRLKERHNELERSMGEILAQFVGEIKDFSFELYSQHTIELDKAKTVFDYALRLKHRDAEDWVLIVRKEKGTGYLNLAAVYPLRSSDRSRPGSAAKESFGRGKRG